jgi:hypothetical protein
MQSSYPSTGGASRVRRSEGAADYIAGLHFHMDQFLGGPRQ